MFCSDFFCLRANGPSLRMCRFVIEPGVLEACARRGLPPALLRLLQTLLDSPMSRPTAEQVLLAIRTERVSETNRWPWNARFSQLAFSCVVQIPFPYTETSPRNTSSLTFALNALFVLSSQPSQHARSSCPCVHASFSELGLLSL